MSHFKIWARMSPHFKKMSTFARDTKGEVMMMFGLLTMIMFMMIGLAVDTGRWLNARDHTISAIDSAVLAAGRVLQTTGSEAKAKAAAEAFYAQAIESRIATFNDNVTFKIEDSGTSVTADGNAYIKTPFMALAGVRELPLIRNNAADYSKAKLAVGGNSEINIETVLMLDTSGSMGGSKIDDLKEAASDLVNIIVWDDQSEYTSKVALVPFSADVRPPTSVMLKVAEDVSKFSRYKYKKGKIKGEYWYAPTACVAERGGNHAYSDHKPMKLGATSITRASQRVWSSSSNSANCVIHWNNTVMPLTNSKSSLLNRIDDLRTGGGTAGHIGTAWSYYALSPNWSTIWAAGSKPADYGDADHRKIAVLMTDGEYNFTYDKDGAPTSSSGGSRKSSKSMNGKSSAEQAKKICDNMKADGIEVYTVGFQLPNQTSRDTMNYCATDSSKAFTADDGEELKRAFREIALQISTLYLSQ